MSNCCRTQINRLITRQFVYIKELTPALSLTCPPIYISNSSTTLNFSWQETQTNVWLSTFKQCLSTTAGNQHPGTPKLSKYFPVFSTQLHHTLWTNSESNTTFVYIFLYICFKSLVLYMITAELSDPLASLKAQLLLSRAASFLQGMPKMAHVWLIWEGPAPLGHTVRTPLLSHSPREEWPDNSVFWAHKPFTAGRSQVQYTWGRSLELNWTLKDISMKKREERLPVPEEQEEEETVMLAYSRKALHPNWDLLCWNPARKPK